MKALNLLACKSTSIERYRLAFDCLGVELGKILATDIVDVDPDNIMLVCASEDADWLAKGVENGLGKGRIPFSVFWNCRSEVYKNEYEKLEISPIVKSYEEPIQNCKLLIIVKSIISSSCVVKTQLMRMIGKITPQKIVIMAPVMYKDGIPNLKREFPENISKRFKFVAFAIDGERSDSGEVIPGIGGLVYNRLGLGNMNEKNNYIPEIIKERIS